MTARIITAALLAAVACAALLLLPGVWLGVLLLPLVWLATREWAHLSGASARTAHVVPALAVACGSASLIWQPWPSLMMAVAVAAAFWLIYTAALILTRARPLYPGGVWCGGLLIWAAFAALLVLHHMSAAWALAVLVMIWASDIGAFFTGRRLGGARLAERISPGKTRSGLAGGLIAGLAAGVLCFIGLAGRSQPGLPVFWFALIALPALVAGVAGDLAVSVLKRRAGVKDSGRLLPGHGGLLDRLDSSLAALPVFCLLLLLFFALFLP